ncbi:MAG: ATP-binding cassette domain-containing protein [Magnetococcales bacterium]|nr:ATP-binding cassette domain-containing protein [Magnetococcales bacterium]MBF0322759.1 ATP-binding cassette domain-containing protein [Magnetococcales bacterium]
MEFLIAKFIEERREYAAQPPPPTAIRFAGVTKTLDGRKVLDRVDLEIPQGKITAIIGVSGGGKSVSLKHMIGLMAPDAGQVFVGDQELGRLSRKQLLEVRERFSMLFQGSALFDSMSVFDNVAFPLREKTRHGAKSIAKMVHKTLSQVGLSGVDGKFPDELSGGMMKRVALARALVTQPEVILLDEPTAGLDPIIENAIHHLICETYMRTRYTMVIISHAIPQIFNWCHHVLVLHEGKILESGPAIVVMASQHPVIKQFINGSLIGPIKVI